MLGDQSCSMFGLVFLDFSGFQVALKNDGVHARHQKFGRHTLRQVDFGSLPHADVGQVGHLSQPRV